MAKLHTCLICGQEDIKFMSNHLQKHDRMKVQDYYNKYMRVDENDGLCDVCGKHTTFNGLNRGYNRFCSKECSNSEKGRDIVKPKAASTREKKYEEAGSKNQYYKNRDVKTKDTKINKHGSLDAASSKMLENRRANNMETYGVESTSQLQSTKDKRIETILKVHGSMDNFVNKLKQSQKDGIIKKYGSIEEFKKSMLNNQNEGRIEKYGSLENYYKEHNVHIHNKSKYNVENITQLKHTIEKRKSNYKENHGVEHHMQVPEIKEKVRVKSTISQRKRNYDTLLKQFSRRNLTIASDYDKYVNMEEDLIVKCKHCDRTFKWKIESCFCVECFKDRSASNEEKEVRYFLESIGIENMEFNVRVGEKGSKKEMDIYLPDYNLCIEYDGVYWHSSAINDDANIYHVNKMKVLNDLGIEVINIFSNEWILKREIVESILKNRLNKNKDNIYARKTEFREVSPKDAREFLENNHIQGYANSSNRFGLYYLDELVSIATFGKSRYKKGEIELLRYVNKIDTSIIGGFSKLMKNAVDKMQVDEINTYCDLRYFNAKGYEKVGFELVTITKPNYFYIDMKDQFNLQSRLMYQKHKLQYLEGFDFDPNLTEFENMDNNGYFRIYDCGNKKLKYTVK